MNSETTLAVRKAIQYFSDNVERERLVGGSTPDNNALIVALKPEYAPEANEAVGVGPNGSGAASSESGASDASTNAVRSPAIATNGTHPPGAGNPAELQGILVIPDRGSDYGIIMEKLYDGTPVGSGGDVVSKQTRIEMADWLEENLDEDGSLSASYVASLGASILNSAIKPSPTEEGVNGAEDEEAEESLSPEDLINSELDRAAAQAAHRPIKGKPQDEPAIEETATEETATEETATEETATEETPEETPEDPHQALQHPEAHPGERISAISTEEQAEIHWEADQEDQQNAEQARLLREWIAEHGGGDKAEDSTHGTHDTHADNREDHAPEAALGQYVPGDGAARTAHSQQESQGTGNYDPEAAKRRESSIKQEHYSAMPQEDPGSNTTVSGQPQSDQYSKAGQGTAAGTAYASHSGHIRSGLQEDHPEREAGLHSETYDWLEALSTGKTQTPEQRQYLIAKHRSGKLVNKILLRKKPQPPRQLASIPEPEAGAIDRIAESDKGPGIVVPMISKGGTGKTTVSIETAFALAMMFGAHGNNTSARTGRVLLLDMNLTNPDLAHRIAVDGAGTSGLKDLINGDHLSKVVNRTALPNLDALFLLGRRDNDKGRLPDVLGDPYAMNSLISAFLTNNAYDAIVVDTANTLPGEEDNPASYALTMWANAADARYLVLQPEIASFRNAALFATRLTEALGPDNSELVPLINSFPTRKVYEEARITKAMADKRRATHQAVGVLEREPSINVAKPRGQGDNQYLETSLFIPDYPEEVRGFAAEGRPISMFSQTFASAYSRVALDAVRRMVNNRKDNHEEDNGNGPR